MNISQQSSFRRFWFKAALVLTVCSFPLSVFAARPDSITQAEYRQLVIEQNPNFASEALNAKIADEDLGIQKAGEEWELELNAQQAHQEELFPSIGPDQIEQSVVGASVGRPIWETGAFVSIDAEGAVAENEYSQAQNFSSPSETQSQKLSFTVSQPLLKNFLGSQSSLAYDLSRYSASLTRLQVEERQEQFLFTMMDEYLDWVLLDEERNINEQRYELSKKQSGEINKRYQKSLVEKIDLLRAKDAERGAEQQYLLSASRFIAKSKVLASLNNSPALETMRPEFSLYVLPELPDLYSLLEAGKAQARTIRIKELQQVQIQRQLESKKNEERAELNLDLRATYKEEEQEGDVSAQPQPDASDDGQDYSVGLVYKKKLGNKGAKGELRKKEIQLEQLALEKQYAQMELAGNIKNLHIQLRDMEKILQLNREMVQTAQQTTEEEQKVYQQGRSDLTNVITSRDQTQNAKLQYARNAINYQKLYLQLESLTDRLLAGEGE